MRAFTASIFIIVCASNRVSAMVSERARNCTFTTQNTVAAYASLTPFYRELRNMSSQHESAISFQSRSIASGLLEIARAIKKRKDELACIKQTISSEKLGCQIKPGLYREACSNQIILALTDERLREKRGQEYQAVTAGIVGVVCYVASCIVMARTYSFVSALPHAHVGEPVTLAAGSALAGVGFSWFAQWRQERHKLRGEVASFKQAFDEFVSDASLYVS